MAVIAPEFMKQFRCIGAECPDTCCKGWNMQVSDENYEKYKKEAPELLESVAGEPGQYVMRRDVKTSYCVKFTEGLCGIQNKYGEAFLGDACHFYPRVTRKLGDTVMMTATLSCPEIARLALFDHSPFLLDASDMDHIMGQAKDYLPASLSTEAAIGIYRHFIEAALDESVTAERALMRIFTVCESLERIDVASWPDAVPFYLAHADSGLPAPEGKPTDQCFLLQALCGLMVAAKKTGDGRLMHTVTDMQHALHVTVRMDNLAIVALPDSDHALQTVLESWRNEHAAQYEHILRRYLAVQLSQALFPFCGFGDTLTQRIAIIGVRLATIKLALMCASTLSPKPLTQDEIIRAVQSIARFMDHLADPEFSVKIYQETGWLKKPRLRALLGDGI
ncbi:MAG TPA: flagellin lysine-N-methylase [Rickettsiales bacterium]|nr:flagellin lysine-N-methylase [Rickettsiales bacterium]